LIGDKLLDSLIDDTVQDRLLRSNDTIMPCTRPGPFSGHPWCSPVEKVKDNAYAYGFYSKEPV